MGEWHNGTILYMKNIENINMERPVFQMVPIRKESFLQRLFKQRRPENAIIELNNILASSDILTLETDRLRQIESKYKLSLSDFELNLQEFFAVYWNQYLVGNATVSLDKADKLAALLGLSASTVEILQVKIGKAMYETTAKGFMSGGRFSLDDERELDTLRKKMKLPQTIAAELLNDLKQQVFQKYVDKVISKNRCTPTEEQEAFTILANFNLEPAKVKASFEKLKTLKYYWELENLPLKTVDGGEAIQKSETCYFKVNNVKWFEVRGSGGNKHMEQVNHGTLYLTNKRLVFEGFSKNSLITYDKVLRISRANNGITIHKDKGKDPLINFSGDYVIFELVMKRLIR
jgi:hypothetical protein